MDLAASLVERHFGSAGGELLVGGVPVGAIVAEHGTPLFLYDAAVLERKAALLRSTYPPEFDLYYSVKANPNRAILRLFLARGFGLEIASGGELHEALASGCPADRILFAGPGKSEAELQQALEHGIGEIHVESATEADRVARFAAKRGVKARVSLRVNPGSEAQGGAMRMGGKPTPFGVDEESLWDVLDPLLRQPSIAFQGIHLFAGTQILDAGVLEAQYRKGIEIAVRIAERAGISIRTLDFGGGLGIPYFPNERDLDTERLAGALRALVGGVRSHPRFRETRFLVEPGRFLVGESGIYVARVSDVKTSRGKTFLILDGGMNHHLAASGNLGQVLKRNFPVAVVNRLGERLEERVDVVGPLCTPLDVLARDAELPRARIGDLVGVFQSGAYARTASPLGFLSQPSPAEILVSDGRPALIRRRGTFEDLARDLP